MKVRRGINAKTPCAANTIALLFALGFLTSCMSPTVATITDGTDSANVTTGDEETENTAPTISSISDVSARDGDSISAITLTFSDTETANASLTASAAMSSSTFSTDPSMSMSSTSTGGSLAITPTSGVTGSATITVTVTDPEGLATTASFTLSIDGYCTGDRLTNTPFADGAGTEGDPWIICTATQMNTIGTDTDYFDDYFELKTNIDMSSITGSSYNLIGDLSDYFSGEFDGNNYTISNFTYEDASQDIVGLFGTVTGVIENFTISGCDIVANDYAGCVAAFINSASATNITVTDSDTDTDLDADQMSGGAFGVIQDSTVTNVSVTGATNFNIVGGTYIGGFAGLAQDSIITECDSYVTMTSMGSATGGFMGAFTHGDGSPQPTAISKSYSRGTIASTNAFSVGGFVGHTDCNSSFVCSVSESFSSVDVTFNVTTANNTRYSPFIGILDATDLTDVFSLGDATTTGEQNQYGAGGLAGEIGTDGGTITNAYASGLIVVDSARIGGLVGNAATLDDADNSFFAGQLTRLDTSSACVDAGFDCGYVFGGTDAISSSGMYYNDEASDYTEINGTPITTGTGVDKTTFYDLGNAPMDGNWSSSIWSNNDCNGDNTQDSNDTYPYLTNVTPAEVITEMCN